MGVMMGRRRTDEARMAVKKPLEGHPESLTGENTTVSQQVTEVPPEQLETDQQRPPEDANPDDENQRLVADQDAEIAPEQEELKKAGQIQKPPEPDNLPLQSMEVADDLVGTVIDDTKPMPKSIEELAAMPAEPVKEETTKKKTSRRK